MNGTNLRSFGMFYSPKGSEEFSQGFLHKSEDGEYLNTSLIVRMETGWKPILLLRRRGASAVMVLPHDLEPSLDAPKSNVA
jgi:hypothetical protein